MGEEVALAFVADVEQAVAGVRELAGSAQELAGTAKEAADGVASIAAPADEAAVAAERLTVANDEAAAAAERLAVASKGAGDAAGAAAAKSDAAAGGGLGKYKMAFVGVAVGAALAVKAASDWQDSTTHLVTDAGESSKNLAMVQQGMLAIAAATGTSTRQISDGMYHIESAGYHGAQGLSILRVAAEGAKVGGADLDTIGKTLTGTLNAYGMTSDNAATQTKYATSMMNQLIATVGAGDMRMQDLAASLGNVAPVAAAAKIKFSEVGGALATMTAQNMSAQQATQDLRHTILALESPNKVAQTELLGLGLSARQVQDSLGTKGLAATMQMVAEAAKAHAGALGQTYTQAMYKAMGGTVGLTTALMLTGSRMATFKANAAAVAAEAKKGGDAVDNWGKIQGTFKFKVDQAKASIESMGISLGTALLPTLTAILGPIAHFLSLIAANKAASIALAVVIGGLLAGAIGKKLGDAISDTKKSIEGLGEGIEKVIKKYLEWRAEQAAAATEATAAAEAQTVAQEAQTAATEAQTVATEAETVAQDELDAAQAASPIGLIIIAVIALAIAIYELVKHWKTVWRDITAITDDVLRWLKGHWPLVLAILTGPIGLAVLMIVKYWHDIEHWILSAVDSVLGFLRAHWPLILAIMTGPVGLLVLFIIDHFRQIVRFLEGLPAEFFNLGRMIIMGLIHGIENAASGLLNIVSGLAHQVSGVFGSVLHILSPSRVFAEHGANIVRGLVLGIQAESPRLQAVMRGLGSSVGAFGGYGGGSIAGGGVNVTVPLTLTPGTQGFNDPRFLQYLQAVVQEAILRYNVSNPSNGLAITAGGRL